MCVRDRERERESYISSDMGGEMFYMIFTYRARVLQIGKVSYVLYHFICLTFLCIKFGAFIMSRPCMDIVLYASLFMYKICAFIMSRLCMDIIDVHFIDIKIFCLVDAKINNNNNSKLSQVFSKV